MKTNPPITHLRVKRIYEDAKLPTQATNGSAALDLYAHSIKVDYVRGLMTVGTGIATAFSPDFAMMIYNRSGLATRHGIGLRNSVAVIDSDYRGEIILVMNFHNDPMGIVTEGSRIAQAILHPIPNIHVMEVNELDTTDRGTGGFGSTGS